MQYRFFTKIFNRFSYRLSHRNFNNQSSRFSSSLNRSSKAFTLIEILIYTAIFSVVAAGIIGVAWNVTRIHTSQIAENEVDENLRYVMDLINSKVRDASIIQDATGTTLILQMPDSTKSPVIFSLNNGTIFMQEGTADPVAITSDKVVVTALEFQRVSMPRAKDGVRINLTIAYKEPAGSTGAEREYLTTVSRVHAIVFDSDILPQDSSLYNVGLDAARWKSGYFSDNINVGGNITAVGTVTGSAGLCMGSDCRSSWGQVTGVTGSGTQNYITKWASSGSLTNSQIFDNGTSVGIGTTSPGALLDVQGAAQFGTGNVNLINSAGKITGISSTYFADLSGANLTNLNASNLSSGTVPTARVSGSYTGITGVGTLTAGTWNATAIADAYIASASTWNAKMTNPMTTVGDIIYGGTSGAPTRLAGSAGFLKSTGAAAPTWTALSATDIPGLDASKITSGTLPVARGGTGADTFSSGYLIKGNGTNALSSSVIYDNGTNVGIGTTAPGAKLHVYDSSSNVPLLVQAGYGSSAIKFKDSSTIGSGPFVGSYGDDLQLGTGDLQRMRITSAGNVGIGTTSPGTKLDVAGDFKTVKYGVYDEEAGSATGNINGNYLRFLVNNGEKVRITSDGNVGIGTTAPSAQLHTTSGVRFQGIANNFTNRRMIVSDTSGNLAYRDLENPISFLDAPFGQYVMYTPTTNNVLFAADKRFTVTQTDFSSFSAGGLFNSNYDDLPAKITTDNATGVININLIEKGEFGSSGLVYSYGWVYVHFYHYYYTDNVKVRLKTKNAGGEFVWRDYVVGTNISSQDNTRVMKIPLFGNYYCSDIEIDITADTVNGSGTKNVWVSEIEFIVNRSASEFAQPIVSKHLANSIYGTMSFKNGSNVVTASIIPSTGAAYFLGNVGIGTTSPGYKLDVVGDIKASGSVYGTYAGTIAATKVAQGQFGADTGGGNYSFPGNVGIGTTSPAALLDVQGAAQFGTGNVNLINSAGKIAGISSTYFADLSGANLTSLNASNLASGTVPSARISGSYTGITGVGTLTAGTWNATAIADAYIASASTWNAKMTNPMTTVGDIIYGGTGGAPTRLGGSAGFLKSTGAAAPTWTTLSASDITSGTLPVARGGTGAGTFTSGYLIKGNGTSALSSSVIYDNGTNVGIGTTSPGYKLDVAGTVGFQTAIYGNAKAVAETGDAFLRINQSNQFTNGIWFGSSDLKMGGGILRIGSQGGAGEVEISGTSGDATTRISISGNSGANSWFNTGGKIGIGTTSPAKTLDVVGDIQASGSVYGTYAGTIPASQISQGQFGSGSGGGIYSFPSKLGVGTSTPTTALEVVGKIKTGSFQLAAGAIEGYVLTADASGNATWQPSLPGLPSATTGQTIYFNGTNWAASSNLYHNDSKVGVGTTSPQAKFHVNTTSGSYVCTGVATSCLYFSSESTCIAQSGCSWESILQNCSRFTNPTTCGSYEGCMWVDPVCEGQYFEELCYGSPTQCSTFGNQTACQAQAGCSWSLVSDPAGIFTGGSLLVGTTTPTSNISLKVAGDVIVGLSGTGSSYNVYAVSSGGGYKLVRYSSSLQYKENISDFNLGLETVLKMKPVEFTWKSTGERDFGFIAEETEKVAPVLVTYLNGKPEAVKYTQYAAVLTNAIKEQQKQIEALSERVKAYGTQTSTTMSSGEFNERLKKAFNDLKGWIATQTLKVKELIAEKILANTIRVKQIEMVDKATGEIYCTWIENGELMKKKGECR